MSNISDMIEGGKFNPVPIEVIMSDKDKRLEEAMEREKRELKRKDDVQKQYNDLVLKKQRTEIPDAKEFNNIVNSYFTEIFVENHGKYTFHVYLGLTERDIEIHILTDQELKDIYEFAIEKFKSKGERMLQIAGRSTDAFTMQNLAGWRKKDLEDKEENSGLDDLHKAVESYKNR